ncbi:Glucose-6-phosphate 1-epimerase-like protein [Elsinoe fawcettii]|nr:Glucose-6-phosphate 1-epimerase-like protein [Elsinoe fawcettii]
MANRANKPAPLTPGPNGPQPIVDVEGGKVTARLPSGESVEIYLYGASITSWKNDNGSENLWVSEAAKLDGSKAIRGGVPVVFPNFGPAPANHATSALPQHGFARISTWDYLGKSSSESAPVSKGGDSAVRLDFGLSPNNLSEEMKKAWPHEFNLVYSVTLGKEGLQTVLEVRNPGTEKWEFQFLTHTYFRVPDISKVTVTGLAGVRYTDKVLNATEHTSSGNELKFEGQTDRVYKSLQQNTSSILIDGKPGFDVVRDNLQDTVIWNPWKEGAQAISDFAPKDGYKTMVCVEAGSVNGWTTLEGNDGWEAGQVLKSYL